MKFSAAAAVLLLLSRASAQTDSGPPGTVATAPPATPATAPCDAAAQAAELLGRVEERHAKSAFFRAAFLMEQFDALESETDLRRGRVIVDGAPGPERSFAIIIDQHIDSDGRGSTEARRFVYRDGWLAEIDETRKQFIKRQLARRGEALDPLRVGEGPFPLPLGQRRDDVLREFEAFIAPMPERQVLASMGECVALRLIPRAGTPLARETAEFRIAYDPVTLLPKAIEVLDVNGDRTTALVRDASTEQQLSAEEQRLLSAETPSGAEWSVDLRPLAEPAK